MSKRKSSSQISPGTSKRHKEEQEDDLDLSQDPGFMYNPTMGVCMSRCCVMMDQMQYTCTLIYT